VHFPSFGAQAVACVAVPSADPFAFSRSYLNHHTHTLAWGLGEPPAPTPPTSLHFFPSYAFLLFLGRYPRGGG
jgi:hypothetical protein